MLHWKLARRASRDAWTVAQSSASALGAASAVPVANAIISTQRVGFIILPPLEWKRHEFWSTLRRRCARVYHAPTVGRPPKNPAGPGHPSPRAKGIPCAGDQSQRLTERLYAV